MAVRVRRNTDRRVVQLLRRISADCRELCAQQNWREKRLQPDELFGQCAGMPPKVKSWIGVRDNAKQTSCNDKDEMRSIQNGTCDAIYLESVHLVKNVHIFLRPQDVEDENEQRFREIATGLAGQGRRSNVRPDVFDDPMKQEFDV